MLGAEGALSAQEQSPAGSLIGRLATVEPAKRRLTVLPQGEAQLVELFVAVDGDLSHDDKPMTLADLVIQVGRRVAVEFRLEGARRVVERLTVEPD